MSRILAGEWLPDRRIPSVRELSVELTVNTHTVLKAFDLLSEAGIIISRRGMGYYLTPDARDKVHELRRREFYEYTLQGLAETMRSLGISMDDLTRHLTPLVEK